MAPKRSHRAASAAHKNMAEPDGADSWDDSDEEEQPKPARAGAKRKAPRAAAGDADRAPQPAKQRRIKQPVDVHDLTLLEIILSHSNAVDTAVKEWVEHYRANRAAATAELMTLLVKACGADDELTEEDVEGGEVDSIAQRLTQMVHEEGGHNLFAHTRQAKAFTGHYCLFWDKLLRALAQAELLFDDFELNDKLTRLVTALNISVVRPFRHAATLTAAQLVSSWIAVSKGLAESRNLTQAQLDAEERKKGKFAEDPVRASELWDLATELTGVETADNLK